MKKTITAILSLAVALSCTKEMSIPATFDGNYTLKVGITEAKVSFGEHTSTNYKMNWEAGDSFNMYSYTEIPSKTESPIDGTDYSYWGEFKTSDSGASASFTGTRPAAPLEGNRFGFYPYKPTRKLQMNKSGDVYRFVCKDFDIPAVQDGTGAPYIVGIVKFNGDEGKLTITNSFMKFTLSSLDDIRKVVITASYEKSDKQYLAGDNITMTQTGAMSGGNSKTITIQKGDNSVLGGDIYVATRQTVGNSTNGYVTLTFDFFNADGKKVTKTATLVSGSNYLNLRNSYLYDFGSFEGLFVKDEPDDPTPDPTSDFGFDYSKLATKGHPRVMLDADDFAAIKARVVTSPQPDDILVKLHGWVMKRAANVLSSKNDPLTYTLSGGKLLSVSRNALERLFACSYAYRITGAEDYLAKARTDLAAVCAFNDWHPSHYLDVAEMSLAVAIAYDWLYDDLSAADRVAARKALSEFALKTADGHYYVGKTDNWNQVCNGGLVAAAVAVYEKDKTNAAKIIEQSVEGNKSTMKVLYGNDGNTPEGYDYWEYGTVFEEVYLQTLSTAFGTMAGIDTYAPGFAKTGRFLLFMHGPNGVFSFADGGSATGGPQVAQWWLATHFDQKENLVRECKYYESGTGLTSRLSPMAVIGVAKSAAFEASSSTFPTEKIWSGGGICPVAIIRDGWTFTSSDTYVGMKGGHADSNHGHMDAGSFVYDSRGVRWVADFAELTYTAYESAVSDFWTMSQSSKRWDILQWNNLFHSTLSFENTDGSVSGKVHTTDHRTSGNAYITSVSDTDTDRGATFDLSAVFPDQAASVTRRFKYDGTDLYVIDEVTAKQGMDAKMIFNLVTATKVSVLNKYLKFAQDGKELYITTSSSDNSVNPDYTSWDYARPADWTPRSWDSAPSGAKRAGFTATVPAGKTVTFTTRLGATLPQGIEKEDEPEEKEETLEINVDFLNGNSTYNIPLTATFNTETPFTVDGKYGMKVGASYNSASNYVSYRFKSDSGIYWEKVGSPNPKISYVILPGPFDGFRLTKIEIISPTNQKTWEVASSLNGNKYTSCVIYHNEGTYKEGMKDRGILEFSETDATDAYYLRSSSIVSTLALSSLKLTYTRK